MHATAQQSPSSANAGSDASWAQFDSNQDGFLSRDELESQHAVALLRDMRSADRDHDGRVSRQEWDAWWPLLTKSPPAESLSELNGSSAPTNGVRID
ncbi:MAG: EF-hand domain-containing protein [Dokdonella sp.]